MRLPPLLSQARLEQTKARLNSTSNRIKFRKEMFKLKRKLKQSLCVMMSILLLMPLAGLFSADAEESPLSLFIATDCHYQPLSMLTPIEQVNNLPGDPLYWHTNGTGEMNYENIALLNAMLAKFEASASNTLLIAGDISYNGLRGQHLGAAEIFKQFEARTGKRIFIINGNHDICSISDSNYINLAEFKTLYADFGYNEALDIDPSSASYTADLGGGYRLIAIDSCVYGEQIGKITPAVLNWVEKQATRAKADGKKLIGMMHHSLLEHFRNEGVPGGGNFIVENYRDIASKFADWGIKTVFTGHIHSNDISSAVSAKGSKIYDIETNALFVYPNSYRSVTFSNTGIKVDTGYIDSINTAYLDDGCSRAQLDLMQRDFHAYSLGYLKAGLSIYTSQTAGSPDTIASALKIKQGSDAYKALAVLMPVLSDALSLPIEDKAGTPAIDSIREIAASVGQKIEPGDYAKLSDILGILVARFYAGDENTPYNSPEITLLFQCVKAALVYAFVQLSDEAASSIFKSLGLPGCAIGSASYKQAAKLAFARTAANKISAAVLTPLVQSFTVDSFGPGDLNVTLDAYGVSGPAAGKAVPITDFQVIIDYIERLFNLFFNVIKTALVF